MRPLLILLLQFVFVHAAVASEADSLERGRELSNAFMAGESSRVWGQMDPMMQRFAQSEEAFSKFSGDARAKLGEEIEVVSETVQKHDGFSVYERVSKWSSAEALNILRWEFTDDGKVVGFGIHEQKASLEPFPSHHLDYVSKAALRLPFDGEWLVFWGGRSTEQNIHATQQQQRFALDFATAVSGKLHQGNGLELGDYYCWGKPIHSPADGTIVSAVVDLPDQPIGSMDKRNLAGNYLVIDLGEGEYALLAHFRQSSIKVKAGDLVKSGDELGQCGNSGNSSQPHLHFHIQNSPEFGEGDGLPAHFVDYAADGSPVERGEPIKGQIVHSR